MEGRQKVTYMWERKKNDIHVGQVYQPVGSAVISRLGPETLH